MMRLKPNP